MNLFDSYLLSVTPEQAKALAATVNLFVVIAGGIAAFAIHAAWTRSGLGG